MPLSGVHLHFLAYNNDYQSEKTTIKSTLYFLISDSSIPYIIRSTSNLRVHLNSDWTEGGFVLTFVLTFMLNFMPNFVPTFVLNFGLDCGLGSDLVQVRVQVWVVLGWGHWVWLCAHLYAQLHAQLRAHLRAQLRAQLQARLYAWFRLGLV